MVNFLVIWSIILCILTLYIYIRIIRFTVFKKKIDRTTHILNPKSTADEQWTLGAETSRRLLPSVSYPAPGPKC